mmetsp:Transcript_22223/g.32332  ORF Transcript_22223/g.32332 Transcript_22223/m.32332 type:complete len:459 (+) Transcript_22223:67-1443(+)|eukprot:CAMPEP_0185025568 /NCGR_PEP_ID=MMETSP1103-20130426/8470_1 /TAXON_ID=36769 /ORGANISM="Paraphysomonas bandaiensis, Strain Caron Lab Isolate" /LENGTH=458 /DNA_ID=CAMNT_0027558789 /DNA_START=58 /DNA_END=1434 /DNA_ORIENTATION=+
MPRYLPASISPWLLICFLLITIKADDKTTNTDNVIVTDTDSDRPPSMFKIGDDWLALPEVFSNLDFQADNTPAPEHDIDAQMRLRSSRFWGRLYLNGWPQTIQFFRAHFGIEPPYGKKRFVFAEPRDACGPELENAHLLTSDHIVLANRGRCTYGQKALNVKKTAASAIIIINNEPGIDHLPGPDAHDVQLSVGSISQQEGNLLELFYDDGPAEGGFGRYMEGYMVPINCENSGARCVPATYQERAWVKELVEGGIMHIHSSSNKEDSKRPTSFEYLLAHFGTRVAHQDKKLPLVMSKPAEACEPLEKDVKGKAVLVRRGSCSFVQKAEHVQNAGGIAMIVSSLHSHLLRMGVEPRWKGLNTAIPVVGVSKQAYSALVGESYGGGTISFEENAAVNGTVWEGIEKLKNGEGWPRSSAYVTKKYQELQDEHAGWPERLEAIRDAYNAQVAKHSGPESEL